MKKLGLLLLPILAITLLLGGNAFADDTYQVTYYSNANTTGAPDGTLRVTNTGATVVSGVSVNLYTAIYVFDDSEELQECCSCVVTPDGLLSESVNKELTNNTVTGIKPTRGIIKVIGTTSPDPSNITSIAHGLAGWMTQIQGSQVTLATSKWSGPFTISQSPLTQSTLSAAELSVLNSTCGYAIILGSGRGTCSCTPEDQDF
jgi:hypothetical protein